jgi:hypothetical protein
MGDAGFRALMITAGFFAALPVSAQTVDEIVAKNLEARGGLDRMLAIETVRITAREPLGQVAAFSVEDRASDFGVVDVIIEAKRPNMQRQTTVAPGMTAIAGSDGRRAWTLDTRTRKLRTLPAVPPRFFLDSPLLDYRTGGSRIDIDGQAKADGKPCYRLRITTKGGDQLKAFIDTATSLDVMLEAPGGHRIIYRDWREVGGVKVAHTVLFMSAGRAKRRTVEKVEFNVPLDDERFLQPSGAR